MQSYRRNLYSNVFKMYLQFFALIIWHAIYQKKTGVRQTDRLAPCSSCCCAVGFIKKKKKLAVYQLNNLSLWVAANKRKKCGQKYRRQKKKFFLRIARLNNPAAPCSKAIAPPNRKEPIKVVWGLCPPGQLPLVL